MPIIVNAKDFKDLPWKNGKGVTREIFRIPDEVNPALFNFRLSMAKVTENAPFSVYPGVERFLMLLEGTGFRLKFEDQADAVLSSPFDSLAFSGEEKIQCELLGSESLDFNVMTNRSWGSSEVNSSILKTNETKRFMAQSDTFIFVYGSDSFLLVLKAGEEYELIATENLVIIEVLLKRKHLH